METQQQFKRNIAYKLRIGQILQGEQVMEGERFKSLKLLGKDVVRVNIVANIIDKYIQEGEKQFGSLTLDDASGQTKVKVFGEDTSKFSDLELGDTILVIGLLRSWNNELYITPDIVKKLSPEYLLLRKLEVESSLPKSNENLSEIKDKILQMVKDNEADGGVDIEKIILDLQESPTTINSEIKKLLEDGIAYEPRPGRLRYLG